MTEKPTIRTRLDLSHLRFSYEEMIKDIRVDLIAAFGELVGTFIFMFVGLGGIQAAATSNTAALAYAASQVASAKSKGASTINPVASVEQLMYISVSMGLSLLFTAWIFYRATGAAFNPNVSFALLLIGAIKPGRFLFYILAQFTGSIAASSLLAALLPGSLAVTPSLGANASPIQGMFIECVITCALILSVLFMAVEKHRATFLAPLGIGLTLFAGHLFAVVYTGAAMNTARVVGPSFVTGFGNDHWIYWVGPSLGSISAVIIYMIMKRFQYWKSNSQQDTDRFSKSPALFLEEEIDEKYDENQKVLLSLGQLTILLGGSRTAANEKTKTLHIIPSASTLSPHLHYNGNLQV